MNDFFSKWFDLRSKAQKKADAEAYKNKILPYGDAQRDKIRELLLPITSVKHKDLLLFKFLTLKDELMEDHSLDIASRLRESDEIYLQKMSEEDLAYFCRLLRIDLFMDASLDYESKLKER